MEPMSRTERAALCNTALESGEHATTLCDGWTVKDLVIHLLVRERDPIGASGILVPKLESLTERSTRRLARQDFTALVERVRSGPPKWSPMAVPPLDRAVNTLEYFVHHEDIRRAAAGWAPRELTEREQLALWKAVTVAGRGLVRGVPAPVEIRWPASTGVRTAQLRKATGKTADPAVVTGPPAELALFLFGRDQHTGLEITGSDDSVTALRGATLGL